MTGFVPPSWWVGLLIKIGYLLIPIIIGILLFIVCSVKNKPKLGTVVLIICIFASVFCSTVLWWENYEVASVNEKVVTVDSWQPKPGLELNYQGVMSIDNANQLMLVTSNGESFLNEEHFLFQKFDTRDVLNTMKPGGVYKIKYYGWREGFNSGFPNILSVEVVNETNAKNISLSDYFGTKLVN